MNIIKIMHYCLISICANIGHNPIFDPHLISMECTAVVESISDLQSELDKYKYIYEIHPYFWSNDIEEQDKEYDDQLIDGDDVCFAYLEKSNNTKKDYIDHIIRNVHRDASDTNKLYSFKKLLMNNDCCELYMYVTSDKSRIVYQKDRKYVLFTDGEKKALWEM